MPLGPRPYNASAAVAVPAMLPCLLQVKRPPTGLWILQPQLVNSQNVVTLADEAASHRAANAVGPSGAADNRDAQRRRRHLFLLTAPVGGPRADPPRVEGSVCSG